MVRTTSDSASVSLAGASAAVPSHVSVLYRLWPSTHDDVCGMCSHPEAFSVSHCGWSVAAQSPTFSRPHVILQKSWTFASAAVPGGGTHAPSSISTNCVSGTWHICCAVMPVFTDQAGTRIEHASLPPYLSVSAPSNPRETSSHADGSAGGSSHTHTGQ